MFTEVTLPAASVWFITNASPPFIDEVKESNCKSDPSRSGFAIDDTATENTPGEVIDADSVNVNAGVLSDVKLPVRLVL